MRAVPRMVPWAVPVLTGAVLLAVLKVPVAEIAGYAAYFAGAVVLPGVLLLRALWRSTGS